MFPLQTALAADATICILTTGDLSSRAVQLSAIAADGVKVVNPATRQTDLIAWSSFVSIERAIAPASRAGITTLTLVNGSRLVGEPAALGETSLQWREPRIGSLSIPLRQVRSIDRDAIPSSASPAPTDHIDFTNGDSASGVITDLSADAISIKTDTSAVTVPIVTIRHATFAATGGAASPWPSAAGIVLRVTLDDGTTLDATNFSTSDDTIKFNPAGAKQPVVLPVSAIVSIEQPGGPVAWLSSRTPLAQTSTPYFPFGQSWPARFGNVTAEASPHGIAVHARSALEFEIEPGWSRLRTGFRLQPVDPDFPAWADITVRVRLGDRIAFEQMHIRADAPTGVIDLPLNGAKTATLEADFSSPGGAQAALTWLEPALLRTGR